MKKEKKDKDFIKSAYFEGGRAALEAFVKKELRYPKEALQAKIEGTVSVRYTVDYKGKVIEAGIISGLGHGCDEEALRIVRKLQFKVPNDGKIKSKYSLKLHIHFRLPGSGKKLACNKKNRRYRIASATHLFICSHFKGRYILIFLTKTPVWYVIIVLSLMVILEH